MEHGHVEHSQVIKSDHVGVQVIQKRSFLQQHEVEAHKVVALEGGIMQIAPAIVFWIGIEPELREPG